MSNEKRTKTIEELNALKGKVIAANPELSESDIMAAIANGVTDSKRLAGIDPYHNKVGTPTIYGAGDAYHDADGVVESTGRGR